MSIDQTVSENDRFKQFLAETLDKFDENYDSAKKERIHEDLLSKRLSNDHAHCGPDGH